MTNKLSKFFSSKSQAKYRGCWLLISNFEAISYLMGSTDSITGKVEKLFKNCLLQHINNSRLVVVDCCIVQYDVGVRF